MAFTRARAFALGRAAAGRTTGAAAVACGLMHLVRLVRWTGYRTFADRLVLILHVAYAFIPARFHPRRARGVRLDCAERRIHAWTGGAIGTMTLAVMSRATLGHTGRRLEASMATHLIYASVIVAALASDLALCRRSVAKSGVAAALRGHNSGHGGGSNERSRSGAARGSGDRCSLTTPHPGPGMGPGPAARRPARRSRPAPGAQRRNLVLRHPVDRARTGDGAVGLRRGQHAAQALDQLSRLAETLPAQLEPVVADQLTTITAASTQVLTVPRTDRPGVRPVDGDDRDAYLIDALTWPTTRRRPAASCAAAGWRSPRARWRAALGAVIASPASSPERSTRRPAPIAPWRRSSSGWRSRPS